MLWVSWLLFNHERPYYMSETRIRNHMIPLILSILLPGLGQFYYGKNVRAILMLILAISPLYPAALVWSVIDVLRLNKQGIQPRFEAKEAVWAIVLLLVIIPTCLFIAFSGMFAVGRWYSDNFVKANASYEEGNQIFSAIQRYHKRSGEHPTDISGLIQGIPIRSGWTTDGWGEEYVYEVIDDGQDFRLISKGKDRTLGSEDDIVFH